MMTDMRVNIAGVELKNPVMTASGTFGSGEEYSEFVDLNRLGAVVTKGVANVPWPGNATPASTFSAREIFPSFRNMARRSSSTSAVMRRKNIWLWLNGWQRKRSI